MVIPLRVSRKVSAIFIALTLVLVGPSSTAKIKSGASCKKIGQKSFVEGTTLICSKVGTKVLWVDLERLVSKPSPAPTVTITAQPSPAPTVAPGLIVGKVYSGTLFHEPKWRWIAAEVSNTSKTHTLNWNYYDAILADANGVIVDSSFETGFPYLGPGEKSWFYMTQFSTDIATKLILRKKFTVEGKPLALNEFPGVSNPRLVTSKYEGFSNRKSVSFTITNNAKDMIMDKYSPVSAFFFDANGIPIYATRGYIEKSILPGGTTEVIFGNFSFDGSYASLEVYVSFREQTE